MNKNKPIIITYDLETSYILSATWGLYKQNVVKVLRQPYILCCAYKEKGKKTKIISLKDFPLYKKEPHNDKKLVKFIRDKVFEVADILIAHNGKGFDQKWVYGRMAVHAINPPSPAKIIDTLLIGRNKFKLTSNKLKDFGKIFGLGDKLETGGIDLWYDIIDGIDEVKRKKAWNLMLRYNIQDVVLLEKIYLHILPYITDHPNIGLMNGDIEACPNCGSKDVHKRGFTYTTVTKYQRWQCQKCYGWHRSPIGDNKQLR